MKKMIHFGVFFTSFFAVNAIDYHQKCNVLQQKAQIKPNGFLGAWSDCSKTCGGGFRTREVKCLKGDENLSVSECGYDISIINGTCNKDNCPVISFGNWSECSKTCGDGIRSREMKCLKGEENRPLNECESNTQPLSEVCNVKNCPGLPMIICENSASLFSPVTENYCTISSLPHTEKTYAFGFHYQSKPWICGGGYRQNVEWACKTPKSDLNGWDVVGNLPYDLTVSVVFDLGNEEYWILGGHKTTAFTDTSLFFKNGNFESGPKLPIKFANHCLAQVNKTFGIISGALDNDKRDYVYIVDGENRKLIRTSNRPGDENSEFSCGWFRNNFNNEIEVVIVGGVLSRTTGDYYSMEIYTVSTKSWRYGNRLPFTLKGGKTMQLDGYFYLFCRGRNILKFQNEQWIDLGIYLPTQCYYPTIIKQSGFSC